MARGQVLEPRGMSREDAAAYCGLSVEGFDDWRRRNIVPGPIPGTHRWDRKALDAALDKASGLEKAADETPLQKWRRERNGSRAA